MATVSQPHSSASPGVNCWRCGYDLRSLRVTGDCPECGEGIGPSVEAAERTQAFVRVWSPWPARLTLGGMMGVAVVGVVGSVMVAIGGFVAAMLGNREPLVVILWPAGLLLFMGLLGLHVTYRCGRVAMALRPSSRPGAVVPLLGVSVLMVAAAVAVTALELATAIFRGFLWLGVVLGIPLFLLLTLHLWRRSLDWAMPLRPAAGHRMVRVGCWLSIASVLLAALAMLNLHLIGGLFLILSSVACTMTGGAVGTAGLWRMLQPHLKPPPRPQRLHAASAHHPVAGR